jgi:exodeoxyribonuclease VII large subunit
VAGAPPEPELPGPFPVGRYADRLRAYLRGVARVRLIGEVVGLQRGRGGHAYFELRDSEGALPCAMWATDLTRMGLPDGALRDGCEVVIAGGPDFYPGGASAAPRFSFRVSHLRLAGEGDLLAKLAELRKRLAAEGLFELQQRLSRPVLPRTVGVITGESGKARRDLVAGFERRGWRGEVVWAFAPVQDRHAAPLIANALTDLAGLEGVEVIIVCRGGGSLSDLWAFCDEGLCRRVALLAKPVISAVGHHTDQTLIDDVAALACSTPTHAAEAAIGIDCGRAREDLPAIARRLDAAGRRAVTARAQRLALLAKAPAARLRDHRRTLHQQIREIRAATQRGLALRSRQQAVYATVLSRKAASAATEAERRTWLGQAAVALRAHDPERVLERGFALVEGPDGQPVTRAAQARAAGDVGLRFADGRIGATIGPQRSDERERAA